MDLKRLKYVKDICPLPNPRHATITSSTWVGPVAAESRPVGLFKNGHTVELFVSRILTWHRSFTRDQQEPPEFDPPSYIYIHEWMPDFYPPKHPGWREFGFAQKQGITFLKPFTDFTKEWSSHARRHLKVFQKSGAALRFGTMAEFIKYSTKSYLPEDVLEHTIEQATSVAAIHPEDVEILVAETDVDGKKEPVGFFIATYCDEVRQTYYIGGYYTALGAKIQAMTGLIHWWFKRAQERNYYSVNFGDMCGPQTLWFDSSIGYSNFKTHFGVHRVWRPRTLWKIRFKFSDLDNVGALPNVSILEK